MHNHELIRRSIMYTEAWAKTGDETLRDHGLFWFVAAVAGKDMALKQERKFRERIQVRDALTKQMNLAGIPYNKIPKLVADIMRLGSG